MVHTTHHTTHTHTHTLYAYLHNKQQSYLHYLLPLFVLHFHTPPAAHHTLNRPVAADGVTSAAKPEF